LRQARANTTARQYGAGHQAFRARIARLVNRGTEVCARCGFLIVPGEAWDLDHSDDRRGYLGPSHARCNRSTQKTRLKSRAW
jgi:hypothetical protein